MLLTPPNGERGERVEMSLAYSDVMFVRKVFGLSQRELARALAVAPFTVARWEKPEGGHSPTGLQDEILRALHSVALEVQHDAVRATRTGGLIRLGVGALIFYLLREEAS